MTQNPLIIVIGAYGSGKSELSINLAIKLKQEGHEKVSLVDLDVVNPYFRSRDVQYLLAQDGIEVISAESGYGLADLPMISPRSKGAINDKSKAVILDVGGDPPGCKVLRRFEDDIKNREYEMIFVVNTKRPFTSAVNEIIEMKEMLESISTLKITEIVCNANLLEQTDINLVSDGVALVKQVAEKEKLLFKNYLVMNDSINFYPDEIDGIKKMNLSYFLSKPWEL